MGRYKKLEVGSTIFAVTPTNKVIKAKIKAIDATSDMPYELDIKSPMRFYPRKDLYTTKEAADKAQRKTLSDNMNSDLKAGRAAHLCVDSDYDKKTHTFVAGNGERVSEYFDLPEKEREELSALMSKLTAFCHKHTLPLLSVVCVSCDDKDKIGCVISSILPGPRVPGVMWAVDDMLQEFREDE